MRNLPTAAEGEREREERVRAAYDEVPYPSAALTPTHPDRLATHALLAGLDPAPVDSCRVFEIGAADGGNLLPMAEELPGSSFLGIDLSPRQVEAGRRAAAALSLPNLDLRAASLLDVDAGWGPFDYLICHGVFSWVSPEAQEKILAICRGTLAPHGVAYLSYNTYPGWYQRSMVREMMLFAARGEADPHRRRQRALELVDLLARATAGRDDPHARFLRETREHLAEYADRPTYVIHEYLEEDNRPLPYLRFVARAREHGLAVLGDAEPEAFTAEQLPPEVAAAFRDRAGDPEELEQHLDFVTNRAFRRTLLVRREAPLDRPAPGAAVPPERLARLYAASDVKGPQGEGDLRPGVSLSFTTREGKSFSTGHPLAQAALLSLREAWPGSLPFVQLLEEVRDRLAALGQEVSAAELGDFLLSSWPAGVIGLHSRSLPGARAAGEKPRVRALARRQAAAGQLVTNRHHLALKLDDGVASFLVAHLDGSRDRAGLKELLAAEARAGHLELSWNGEPVRDEERLAPILAELLEHHLGKMAELALLVS